MNFLFPPKQPNPEELVLETIRLTNEPESEALAKQLVTLRVTLLGDYEKDSDEAVAKAVADAAIRNSLARALASVIRILPLEAQKNVAHIFSNLCRHEGFAESVVADGFTLETLTLAYSDNAFTCGTMLREAAKHAVVTKALLKYVWLFLTQTESKNFDVASDAFELVRSILTHTLASEFIEKNYDFFFECFHRLLHSENYVTSRESLRLLSELLLDRSNYKTMIKYISNKDNLKILMLLLRSKKLRIQIEAFHVFKIFVANPKKTPAVKKVLFDNKDKLLAYLDNFHNDNHDIQEEKLLIMSTLRDLTIDD